MTAKPHSWPALKEQHLLQVAEGPKLPPTAYRVAIVLVSCLNSRTGEAFPSEETLADRLGLDRGANEDDLKKRAMEEVTPDEYVVQITSDTPMEEVTPEPKQLTAGDEG